MAQTNQQPIDEDVPHQHIWKPSSQSGYGPIDLDVPCATDIPVLDLSSYSDADVLSACATWGCFQLVNHGIDLSLLETVRQLSRQFFHLPAGEKQKWARAEDGTEGYGRDHVLFENQTIDWSDRLYLWVSPPNLCNLKYWPTNPPSFSDVLRDYTDEVKRIQELLFKAMARSLNLQEDCFVKRFGQEPKILARFNLYPPCPRPDLVLGVKPHSDTSGITVLLLDEDVAGLQVLKDDHWYLVPTIPQALLINVGDRMEIMSNGVLKSPVHRAVTNSERERNTLALFCEPDNAVEIGPVEELITQERPRAFKTITDYFTLYYHYYQQGKRPLDALRM